jgi:hypothetical protein
VILYIHTHLGLGDQLLTNGLVRTIVDRSPEDDFVVFAKHHNYESVKFMYHDEPRISVVSVSSDSEVYQITAGKSNVVRIGFNAINAYGRIPFDQTFYRQMDVPFSAKWSEWYYKRARLHLELDMYGALMGSNFSKYIFVHDDESRGIINPKYLTGKRIIRPVLGLTDVIFDYVYTIEHASEVHCIDSSFLSLVDQLKYPYIQAPIYFHKYARSYSGSVYDPIPSVNGAWNILEE